MPPHPLAPSRLVSNHASSPLVALTPSAAHARWTLQVVLIAHTLCRWNVLQPHSPSALLPPHGLYTAQLHWVLLSKGSMPLLLGLSLLPLGMLLVLLALQPLLVVMLMIMLMHPPTASNTQRLLQFVS